VARGLGRGSGDSGSVPLKGEKFALTFESSSTGWPPLGNGCLRQSSRKLVQALCFLLRGNHCVWKASGFFVVSANALC
jgi:hypothetical protein